jgi:cytochrome c5
MRNTWIASATLFLAISFAAGAQEQSPPRQAKTPTTASTKSESETGQQVFQRNCSRCHQAPEALPPSISGTVALHMRVRAGLSEQDYKKLLAFLNP